ncbi:hypothetical protein O5D80_008409 [Batrachochytrium dendrobatidis]|nr:hypothetical protein O5D80_008409 [Batrachochytrium dendrobatidis]
MKFTDILLLLTAAATASAILVTADEDGSLQESGTSSQVSVPTNEPNPNTIDEHQQQTMSGYESGSTSSSQRTVLSKEDRRNLNTLKRKHQVFLRKERKICDYYYDYLSKGHKQKSRLRNGGKISGPKHNSRIEKAMRLRCDVATEESNNAEQELKDFMLKHGLKPKGESDSDSD